jgi:WD40 repeat protein
MLITQKHMIIALEDGLIQWNRLEHPQLDFGTKLTQEHHMRVTEEVDQEYVFDYQEGPPAYMHYTRSFKKIIIGTEYGLIGVLPVEAEKIDEDEEEEENQGEKEKKTIVTPFVELGRFHTDKISGIKPLGLSTQLVTISDDNTMAVWEGTTGTQISRVFQQNRPVSLGTSLDGKVAFVGSESGVVRVYDVSNRSMPRMLQLFRFWEENVPVTNIRASHDGKYVIVTSTESDLVYMFSQKVEDEFKVIGHVQVKGYVLDADFAVHEERLRVVGVLSNNLLFGCNIPTQEIESRMDPIPDDIAVVTSKKIDRDINRIVSNPYNGELFVSGKDMLMKNYSYPIEPFAKIEFKKPPGAPMMEYDGHSLALSCHDFFAVENAKLAHKLLVTGGKDGSFILRDFSQMNRKQGEALGHAAFSGGITSLCFLKENPIFFTAGGKGEIMAWNPFNIQQEAVEHMKEGVEEIDRLETVEDMPD